MSTEVEERSEATPAALPPGAPETNVVRDRLLLPLLLPIIAVVTVVVFVLNFSRIFIAAGTHISVIVCSVITGAILLGAALFSMLRRLRPSSMLLALSGVFLVIMLGGSLMIGAAEDHAGPAGYVPPTGDPVATIEVDAFPTLHFQATAFNAPAGIVALQYKDIDNGSHTLAFRETQFAGFLLQVHNAGEVVTGKVQLTAGTYTIYCTLPGHAAAGMQATLTVTAGA